MEQNDDGSLSFLIDRTGLKQQTFQLPVDNPTKAN